MSVTTRPRHDADDGSWYIVGRWREYEGERRANLLRLAAIVAFYGVEMANYHGFRLGGFELPRVEAVNRPFHLAVTALAVAWTMTALVVHLCLRSQVFPASLKYLSTAADLALLTSVLAVSDGPRSPLVVGYFPILAIAALRFSLPLVRFATAGAMVGYIVVLGFAKWYATRPLTVPRYHEVIFLLALALTGVAIGQVLRQVRALAAEFADRREAEARESS
jgi:hypothetical protein